METMDCDHLLCDAPFLFWRRGKSVLAILSHRMIPVWGNAATQGLPLIFSFLSLFVKVKRTNFHCAAKHGALYSKMGW